jgi:hypothetical protein
MKLYRPTILLADTRFMAADEPAADTGAADTAAADAAAAATAAAAAGDTDSGKTFTQAEVNDFVIKRNKGVQRQLETAESTIEGMLKSQSLSTNERAGLETQLGTLQDSMRTSTEQATHNAKKAKIEYDAQLEIANTNAGKYQDLYETQTRNNAILAAAGEHDAFNPDLFIDVLGPRTEIVAEVNEQGEETGRQVPKVRITRTAEDGTAAEVLVTPAEAVVDMKSNPQKFGGLFRSNVAKGIGEGSNSSVAGDSRVDITKMTDDEYVANRDAIAKQYGLNRRRTF